MNETQRERWETDRKRQSEIHPSDIGLQRNGWTRGYFYHRFNTGIALRTFRSIMGRRDPVSNERTKQERTAFANAEYVYRHHFLSSVPNNFTASAIALSEKHARHVIEAEHPGCLFDYDGATGVPCRPLAMRLDADPTLKPYRLPR